MKRIKNFCREERGAYSMIEATIIYPIVFLFLFFVIYVGLYLLQAMTLSAYAQKIAFLSAREVSSPGYRELLSRDKYETSAVEADFGLADSTDSPYEGNINISNKVANVKLRAYRYWYDPLNDTEKGYYESVLGTLVEENSILNGRAASAVKPKVDCDNYVITQVINVTVEQPLMEFGILTFFGVETPTISTYATATVSDTDELVRNTDFAVDAVEMIAEKIGVDTSRIKETVMNGMKKIGLISEK